MMHTDIRKLPTTLGAVGRVWSDNGIIRVLVDNQYGTQVFRFNWDDAEQWIDAIRQAAEGARTFEATPE